MNPTPAIVNRPIAARSTVEELMRPQPTDSHPAAGLSRGVLHLVMLEMDKIASAYDLPTPDDVDEERYMVALAPYLRAIKSAWSEDNQKPLGKELGTIRGKIREFDRWRRLPTAAELSEIVHAAMGLEMPVAMEGGTAEARRVVSAPRALPPMSQQDKGQPSWLPEFAAAVGDNELAQRTFIVPLLNMSEGSARRAIVAIAEGRRRAKQGTGEERLVRQAQIQRKSERRGYIDGCLRSVRQILLAQAEAEQGTEVEQ